MDISNPAVFGNAELLRLCIGRRVQALIQVFSYDDENQIVVKGSPPISLTNFVEVIGIADGVKSIKAEIWTNFGDSIDTHTYNQLCQLANGEFKHLFV
ncbi:hypothetical protein UlMin_003148 [Ulmus minor]